MEEQNMVKITNEKALAIIKFVREKWGVDMQWSTEDGETNLLGFTEFGGCMVAVNFKGEEGIDKISVSLRGAVDNCSIQMYMLATEFDLKPSEPYCETVDGNVLIGDKAYEYRDNAMKEMMKGASGIVDLEGNPL